MSPHISVVLALVAPGAVKGPLAVGPSPPCPPHGALQVLPPEGGVGGSGRVLAGVRVLLGEEGRVGPQLVPLEAQEGLARLGGRGGGGGAERVKRWRRGKC